MDATDCAVRAVREVGPDAVAIDVETPPGFDARPGQFVKLTFDLTDAYAFETLEELAAAGELGAADVEPGAPVEASRFYTVSSPDVEESFEITVGVDPDGTVAPVVADLAAGDVVTVSGPFGNDYYEGEDPAVVLAGGPGIGPAVGIAERAVADGHDAAVVYRDDRPIHEARIDALREAGVAVAVIDGDDDLRPAVAEALDAHGVDSQLFVYGFADFIDAATAVIEAAGGDAAGAKIENFG